MCNAEEHGKSLLPTVMRLIGTAPQPVSPDSPGVRRLIEQSDAYLTALYPPESNHLESIEALLQPNVCFLGIEEDGELVACGAVKLLNDGAAYGEIKRVFVLPSHRGKGFARSLMLALEAWLQQRGIRLARLETGILQPEALGLYRALGFCERSPFGSYRADPLSVFMEKNIMVGD
jgi:putative acetyltransferase